MSNLPVVPLREVAVVERRSVKAAEIEDGTTYVGLEHIETGGSFVGVEIVANGFIASNKFSFTNQHVLYGKLRPYLAKIARPTFHGVCSTDILPILPGPDLDRGYLFHYLRHPAMVELATTRSTGANLPRLSPKVLSEFEIPLPPLAEQRRIAAILDQAEALRAKRRRAIERLDSLTQSIFLEMFGDPVRNPKGWPVMNLKDCVDLIQIGPFGSLLHQSDYISGGIPLINPKNIVDGSIVPDTDQSVSLKKHADLELYHLQLGDVIMGRRGEMGRCAIVSQEHAGMLCGTGSLIIRPDPAKTTPLFISTMLSSQSMRRRLERLSLGTTLANLNRKIVEDISVPLAPLSVQNQFTTRLNALRSVAGSTERSAITTDKLFASLQHRAFVGEL